MVHSATRLRMLRSNQNRSHQRSKEVQEMALKFQITAEEHGISTPLIETPEDEFKKIKDSAPEVLTGVPNIFTVHQFSKNSYLIQIWPSDA